MDAQGNLDQNSSGRKSQFTAFTAEVHTHGLLSALFVRVENVFFLVSEHSG